MTARIAPAFAGILLAIAGSAWAGPPYQTDDPEPTDLGHWEIYNFATLDGRGIDYDGTAGLDLNYGAANGVQLTATLPLAFSHSPDRGRRSGTGDVELAGKYAFSMTTRQGGRPRFSPARSCLLPQKAWAATGSASCCRCGYRRISDPRPCSAAVAMRSTRAPATGTSGRLGSP